MADLQQILMELVGKAFSIQCTSNITTEEKNKQENAAIASAEQQINERVENLIARIKPAFSIVYSEAWDDAAAALEELEAGAEKE